MDSADFLMVLQLAREGDCGAVWAALEACLPELTQKAYTMTKGGPRGALAVSDLVNDTLLEAFRDFHQFRGETLRAFAVWLRQILLHNYYSTQQRARLRRAVSLDALGSEGDGGDCDSRVGLLGRDNSPLSELMRREACEALDGALLDLPEPQRYLISWRFQERLTYREIGSRLGCSTVSARESCLKAVGRLRQVLKRFGKGPREWARLDGADR